jgi:hypothetical protein
MNYVTFGGVTVGLCVLCHYLMTWYPGFKALRSNIQGHAAKLIPFIVGWIYGCLTTLGVAGLVGLVSGTILGLSNWLGDAALVWGVGGNFGGMAAAKTFVPLSGPGDGVLLILTCVFVAALKKAAYNDQLKLGAWCGITLGTSSGVAGFAAVPLATMVNTVGGYIYTAAGHA